MLSAASFVNNYWNVMGSAVVDARKKISDYCAAIDLAVRDGILIV